MRWHYTKRKNLKSIVKEGIRKSSGGLTYFIQDGENGDEIEPNNRDGFDARVGVADEYPMLTIAELEEMEEEGIDEYQRAWRMAEGAVPVSAIAVIEVSKGWSWEPYRRWKKSNTTEQAGVQLATRTL